MINNQNTLIRVAGVYLIVLGVSLTACGLYVPLDAAIKKSLHAKVLSRQAEINDSRSRRRFVSPKAAKMFFKHKEDLTAAVTDFKQKNIENMPPLVFLIVLAGMLMGLAYIAAGIALLRRLPRFGVIMKTGFILWGMCLFLFILNACTEIRFLDYSSVELWQMSSLFVPEPESLQYTPLVKSLFSFSVERTALAAWGWTVFYLLVPLYFLVRPGMNDAWRQTRN